MRRSYVGSGNPNFGKKHSTKTKELIREKAVGRKASLATKIKMSKSHKGKIVWNTGRQTPKEVREKIRASWAKIAYIRIGATQFSKETIILASYAKLKAKREWL